MVKSLIKTIAFLLALASICGLLVLKFDLLQYATAGRNLQKYEPSSASIVSEACRQNFQNIFNTENIENTLKAVSVVVHKNGEAISCGETGADSKFYDQLLTNFASEFGHCPKWLSKYQVESLLTRSLSQLINTCVAPQQSKKGLLGFCDAGPKKTPILLDHQKLIPVRLDDNTSSLPCHFHTREGLRITSLKQLSEMTQKPVQDCEKIQDGDEETQTCKALDENSSFPSKIHLYAVPAGRVFMFAPSYVGEIFHLPHVEGADEKLVYLEVLSLNPRVFDVFNFFSREESQELVDKAKNETSESHRIKRSSTGATGYNINSRRTSESGFDTHGATARKVKKRCFSALGFDEYLESHSDGLQILRYNLTAAYNSHMDWIEDNPNVEHDYQSAGVGGNRFATILMYMTDLEPENGGETVFPKGLPFGGESVDQKEALAELRESEQGKVLEPNSWEEKLVTLCRTKLAIRPHSSRAVLFYSQFPDGRADPASLHGACPVLSGQKYAANLWVWNTPRTGYRGSPIKEKFRKEKENSEAPVSTTEYKQIKATFSNSQKDANMQKAKLFYQDKYWSDIGFDDPPSTVNTYEGHVWNVQVDGAVVKTWRISEKQGLQQEFSV